MLFNRQPYCEGIPGLPESAAELAYLYYTEGREPAFSEHAIFTLDNLFVIFTRDWSKTHDSLVSEHSP
jgi:hypothetical protein